MGSAEKLKRIIYISACVLIIGLIVFLLRGPYISNALKKAILPELEHMLGRKVIAQKIYLNLFPLFIEAKGLKVFDDQGSRVLTIDRAKGYVGLTGILRKELELRRIVIKKPEIWTDRPQINDMSGKVRDYLSRKSSGRITVKAKVVEIWDGEFSFYEESHKAHFAGKGLDGEVILGDVPRLKIAVKELVSSIQGYPELKVGIDGLLLLKEDGIDIKDFTLKSYGSEIEASGFYSPDGKAVLRTDVDLIVDSVKKILGLKQRGEGRISAKGDLKFEKGIPFVDIKLKGNFYLQTLMEVLKVEEPIAGWVDFTGRIKGKIPEITGSADVRLRNGNLFEVDVDDLRCKVLYSNGTMSFQKGNALLYNGRADAEASIELPVVKHYTLKVDFADVDSSGALKLIGWQPEIPKGKVTGDLYTSGSAFNPSGRFDYEAPSFNSSLAEGRNVLDKIKKINGNYEIKNKILTLSDTEAKTEMSTLKANGTADLFVSMLNLKFRLETADVSDLSSPYFNRIKGPGDFKGTLTGKFDDPLIDGILKITSASFDDYILENIDGMLSYRKNLLEIKELSAKTGEDKHSIRGSIRFDKAEELFDLRQPDYMLSVSQRHADLEKLVKIFYKRLPINGRLDSDFEITGKGPEPEYSGSANINDANAYGIPSGSASISFSYSYKDFILKKAVFKKDSSVLTVEGSITGRDRFSFNASANRLLIKDFGLKGLPDDAVLSINAQGKGTFDNPDINLNGRLFGGTFKGRSLGIGTISASVKNKDALLNAVLLDEKMKVKGRARLTDALPWSAEIDMASGRYDFLLRGLLKDMPEDLLLNIKGRADLSGDKKNLNASLFVEQLNISLFGYSFSNDSDIRFKLENRNMSFSAFTMKSGNTSFSLKGNMEIGKEYNIVLEGSSALSPLKGLSKRISVLRGNADFTLTIEGKWDDPKINGSFNVTDALFGLKDFHQRLSAINGYIYFEEDKIVMQRLSGKFSGGDINLSGLVYLKGFSIKRFYLDAKVNNVTTAISKDFTVNFDGDILYKGTLESQNITGDIKVNRAKYRERVEWKSWLLKAKSKEKPKTEPAKYEQAALNIRVYGSENISVDNNIARAPLKLDLVIRGTIGNPLLFGRVESKGGKVYFRNNEFTILNASADFADPNRINPVMEITAQTSIKGYNIKLNLEGQIKHFNLSLTSDPALDEVDILSLLTVGEMGKELKGLEGGIGASEATAFLTGKVQDVFEDRLKNITGLDRVQVDPYVSSTGMVGPMVTVSKRLLAEKLFVTYISSVGSTEEQVLRLEYILGKNISLVGERDEKGSMGGDIKFRFEFK